MNKKFEYKLTKVLWTLFIIGLIAAGVCVYLNLTRFITLLSADNVSSYSYIGSLISALIGLSAFVFIIPAMLSSAYVITDKHLITKWGLVKNKYEVKDITRITHFRLTNKLVVFFEDESYTTINVAPEKYEEFIDTLKSVNNKIFYQLNTEDKG